MVATRITAISTATSKTLIIRFIGQPSLSTNLSTFYMLTITDPSCRRYRTNEQFLQFIVNLLIYLSGDARPCSQSSSSLAGRPFSSCTRMFAKNASPGVHVPTSSQQLLPSGTIRNEADVGLNGALPIGAYVGIIVVACFRGDRCEHTHRQTSNRDAQSHQNSLHIHRLSMIMWTSTRICALAKSCGGATKLRPQRGECLSADSY
jgi:hypothetical protein